MPNSVMLDTKFTSKPPFYSGKVRETYDLEDNRLLLITTDRLSAFDCIFPNGIPDKGKVLNQISVFWFELLKDVIPNHIISTDISDLPPFFQPFKDQLKNRFMIVKKAKRIDVECVVRGYLAGSGWKEYQGKQTVCGVNLPSGLKLASHLPKPIFTPSTKEDVGQHDVNIAFENMLKITGKDLAEKIRTKSLELFNKASEYAETKGILIADTKFEFGIFNNELILIDEILTPDSSRFWRKETWTPGTIQKDSLDKQYIRDYLETLDWNQTPPAPMLPAELVTEASKRYREIYSIISGKEL